MKNKLNELMSFFRRDMKQAGLIVGLVAVGLLLWGRLLLKQVPQTANADDKPQWLVEVEQETAEAERQFELIQLAEPPTPDRDPFKLDPSRYKRTLSEDQEINGAKSVIEVTDEQKRMAVVDAAAGLRLQSITLGDVPAAFINGRLIRLGQTIDGFTLLECDDRSAVLEKDSVKIRLGMGNQARPRNVD